MYISTRHQRLFLYNYKKKKREKRETIWPNWIPEGLKSVTLILHRGASHMPIKFMEHGRLKAAIKGRRRLINEVTQCIHHTWTLNTGFNRHQGRRNRQLAVIADGLPCRIRGSDCGVGGEGWLLRAAPRIISVISSFLRRAPWREKTKRWLERQLILIRDPWRTKGVGRARARVCVCTCARR